MAKASKPAASKSTAKPAAGKGRVKAKKVKRKVAAGIAHINATFNNTYVNITDLQGNTIAWSSAAKCGFSGSRKSTPHAASEAALAAAAVAKDEVGMETAMVLVNGPGPGRESAARAISTAGIKVVSITDVTPVPHNGVKAPKKRRV